MNLFNSIKKIDTDLFSQLNAVHNNFWDTVMNWVTNKYVWIPLYIALLVFIVWKFKKKSWLIILSVIVLITLSDQLSVHLFKNVFQRYRPCHNLEIQNLVHTINGNCGGIYGFVSSHAANTFALAMFLSLLLKNKINKPQLFSILIFGWAAFVSYSRIYVGVHYPSDIIGGALLGIVLGYLISRIYFNFERKI